jgi:hypothetical protein
LFRSRRHMPPWEGLKNLFQQAAKRLSVAEHSQTPHFA